MASDSSSRSFGPEHRLAWALLTLRACERTGLHPVSLRTLHRLTFFANCLAQVYGSQPPTELVMKHTWGPYYPKAQFDIDQLVLMDLVDIDNVSWDKAANGVWKSADFRINEKGFALATRLVAAGDWFSETYQFLTDMCAAYAELDDDKADAATTKDLTYAQAGIRPGTVIDFSTFQRNLSARGAQAFAASAPPIAVPNRQQQLRLYMKFLEGKVA